LLITIVLFFRYCSVASRYVRFWFRIRKHQLFIGLGYISSRKGLLLNWTENKSTIRSWGRFWSGRPWLHRFIQHWMENRPWSLGIQMGTTSAWPLFLPSTTKMCPIQGFGFWCKWNTFIFVSIKYIFGIFPVVNGLFQQQQNKTNKTNKS